MCLVRSNSVGVFRRIQIRTNSHSNTSHDISRIPEADVARVWPAVRRVPRHHHEEHVQEDREDDHRIPRAKRGPWEIQSTAPPADKVQSDGQHQAKERGRIDLEVGDCACQQVLETWTQCDLLKLKASPAGGAKIIMIVRSHLTKYGPRGVPSGFVEAQNRGQGRTPCRPHSRMTRDWPRSTARRLPKELRATKKLRPLTALPVPNTFSRNKLAAICFAAARSSFGTIWVLAARKERGDYGGGGKLACCEVSNVRKNVQRRHNSERNEAVPSNLFDRILHHALVGSTKTALTPQGRRLTLTSLTTLKAFV